jgi:hypothetical protein
MRVRRDERGQAGGVEALAFGLLIFVVGTLIVANAWAVVDAKFAATGSAREATRTYVETGTTATAAGDPANKAATAALTALHRPGSVSLTLADGYRRCGRVTARVVTSVPILRLPFIRSGAGHIDVRGEDTRIIDPYRSGIPGAASCNN